MNLFYLADKEQKEHLDHWGVKYVGDLDDFLSKCDVVRPNLEIPTHKKFRKISGEAGHPVRGRL